MKNSMIAVVSLGLMLAPGPADPAPSFARFTVSDTSFGPGGHLQDATPQDLTDCCGNPLAPR